MKTIVAFVFFLTTYTLSAQQKKDSSKTKLRTVSEKFEMEIPDPPSGDNDIVKPSFGNHFLSLQKFMDTVLNTDIPYEKKAPAGLYKIIIEFSVDTNGHLSDFQSLTNFGYGMEEEAVRVLKLTGRWNAATQSGKKIKFRHRQSISFLVEQEN